MQASTEFLKAIGHTDRVYIRCLSPKNTPLSELESRGMTYTDKSKSLKKSTVNGYLDLQTGIFHRRYGNDYKPVIDGFGYLLELNKQGYGVYYVVGHGGERNSDITHGSVLFHESDRATLEHQQLEIDRISQEFGEPTAVVKTKKSLHGYWASEIIRIDTLPTCQRRWLQYSNCDDQSLSDPAQLMRLPGFDHLTWNPETQDFDRVECKLLQLNEVSYSLEQFDRVLPALDVDRWCKQSLEIIESDASDTDMRSLAQYLPGFDNTGRWIKCKCPAHDGESSDSVHIDSLTGGFLCHAGCPSSAVYNAAKAVAVAAGYRFESTTNISDDLKRLLDGSDYDPVESLPLKIEQLITTESDRWSLPSLPYISALLSVVCSLTKVATVFNIRETRGKPILWVGILGTSNSGKSESMRAITSPMTALQRGANQEYEMALVEYERENAVYEKKKRAKNDEDIGDKPRQPACREYYVDDYTYEALASIYQSQKERGLLLKLDELKAFCDFEKYGTANNRSRMLSLYDGDEMKCNRKNSGRIHIEKTAISLVGTTQYTTLSNIFAKDDNSEDGLWARLVFVNLPTTATYSHDPEPNNELYTQLARIYATIDGFTSQTFTASPGAKDLWTTWYDSMVDRTIAKSGTFLESIYGKAKDRVARIALALHILHAAANGVEPEREVSEETMFHAIGLGKCLLLETEKALALTDANPTTNPEDDRILKFVTRFSDTGWVSARNVRDWWTTKPKPDVDTCRRFMSNLVSLGRAIDNGEDMASSKYEIKISRNGSPSSPKPSQSINQQGFGDGLSGSPSIVQGSPIIVQEPPVREDLGNGLLDSPSSEPSPHNNLGLPDGLLGLSNGLPDSPSSNQDTESDSDVYGLLGLPWTIDGLPDLLKIGDRVKLGDEIFTIDKIEDDFIGGQADDGSYIGGHINSVQLISTEELIDDSAPPTPNGEIERVPLGNGMVEIVRQERGETIDDGEIEYEC
jgi:Protein of unknown function (DUF3987)